MSKFEEHFKFAQESVHEFADGEIVFREGDEGREMYVVIEGEIIVSKMAASGEIVLAHLRKGEFVGEMSLLESQARSATARACGRTRLLAIHPGGFLLKIRRDPTFAFEMLQALSRRIRVITESLMRELNRNGTVTRTDSLKAIIQGAEFARKSEEDSSLAAANQGEL